MSGRPRGPGGNRRSGLLNCLGLYKKRQNVVDARMMAAKIAKNNAAIPVPSSCTAQPAGNQNRPIGISLVQSYSRGEHLHAQ